MGWDGGTAPGGPPGGAAEFPPPGASPATRGGVGSQTLTGPGVALNRNGGAGQGQGSTQG